MNWLNNLFSNAEGETPWWGILISIVVVLIIAAAITAAVFFIVNRMRKNKEIKDLTKAQWTTRELIFGALCIAIAFGLSYLRFFKMPQGGSITPASMLPIMIYAYVYGTPKGLIIGLGYGLMQLLQDAYVVHWIQFIMDYLLAFMSLALAGVFKKSILPGIIAGGLGRFLFSFLSGVIFFGEYAPAGQNPMLYSAVYNITYIGPDTAICFIVALLPGIQKTIESIKTQALRLSPKAS